MEQQSVNWQIEKPLQYAGARCLTRPYSISENPYIAANSNLEQRQKLKPAIFVFTGVRNDDGHPDLISMKDGLYQRLQHLLLILNFSISSNQLTLALTDPDFRFYVSLIEQKQLKDFAQIARDFNLPWDKKKLTIAGSPIYMAS